MIYSRRIVELSTAMIWGLLETKKTIIIKNEKAITLTIIKTKIVTENIRKMYQITLNI